MVQPVLRANLSQMARFSAGIPSTAIYSGYGRASIKPPCRRAARSGVSEIRLSGGQDKSRPSAASYWARPVMAMVGEGRRERSVWDKLIRFILRSSCAGTIGAAADEQTRGTRWKDPLSTRNPEPKGTSAKATKTCIADHRTDATVRIKATAFPYLLDSGSHLLLHRAQLAK